MKSEMFETKFLGMQIDNQLNRKCHIDLILPKLSTAGFIIRKLLNVLNPEILRIVYYASFIQSSGMELCFGVSHQMFVKFLSCKRR
jgi:hypothetical protein